MRRGVRWKRRCRACFAPLPGAVNRSRQLDVVSAIIGIAQLGRRSKRLSRLQIVITVAIEMSRPMLVYDAIDRADRASDFNQSTRTQRAAK